MAKVSLVIAGAGSRGTVYAGFALAHPALCEVIGVAEPGDFQRQRLAKAHDLPDENVFHDWREMAARPRLADAVIIATQDRYHVEPAVAFARKGYHILLEKPMAPTERGCREIVKAVKSAGVIFGVCHVMRYTRYTQALKKVVDSGAIGEIVTIQHLEPLGYWHQAHSFVRGNWRNEKQSSFMLLAKACHDLDWIRYFMDSRCLKVASFGGLKHFRKEARPQGSADRCLDCSIEAKCPYSAKKIYLGRFKKGERGWPLDVLAEEVTEAGLIQALREGPYGRCVYACDNDVVDNQVVIMHFEDGRTAAFTMTAFNKFSSRITRIFGTRGEILGDGKTIEIFDFLTDTKKIIDTTAPAGKALAGHGGGDYGLMKAFVDAVNRRIPGGIISGPDESLESHLMVFAAEKARLLNKVVKVPL